jgi:hypothetical protein
MRIGDYVRFNASHGSIGRIQASRHYDDGFYVRWNYGKDNFGEAITALSSVARCDLVHITQAEYDAHVSQSAWTQGKK